MPKGPSSLAGILEATVSRNGEVTTLALTGELDLATVEIVREKLGEALGDGSSSVVLDLRRLTFIDSTGIAFLLSATKEDREGRLSFVASEAPAVQRVLTITGVAELFGGSGEAMPLTGA